MAKYEIDEYKIVFSLFSIAMLRENFSGNYENATADCNRNSFLMDKLCYIFFFQAGMDSKNEGSDICSLQITAKELYMFKLPKPEK